MIYRIAGGIFFLATALTLLGIFHLKEELLGIIAAIAGIALLAGI